MNPSDSSTNEPIVTRTQVPEDKIVYLPPTSVILPADRPRWRKEMGNVKELAESILAKGQIQPILINGNNELVAGGRRLAACLFAGITVKACYTNEVSPVILREIELEENLRRKAFTAGEEVLAVKELHELKVKEYGQAVSGSKGSGWRLEDTASLVGKSKGAVIKDLQLADAVERMPELKNASKKNAIEKAVKGIERIANSIIGLKAAEAHSKANSSLYTLYHGDSIPYMKELKDGSIDILLTDPMYGIDADKVAIGVGGKTGGTTSAGFTLDDSADPAFGFLTTLANESYRITTSTAHGYIFVGPEHFNRVRDLFMAAGWLAYPKPIIWIKRGTGQCNIPSSWPASCYESLLYVRKQDSKLIKEGMPDWLEVPPVNPSEKTHPYEKPVGVWTNLLERCCTPGQVVYDPCCGSGSSCEASVKQRLIYIGGDLKLEAYAAASGRMQRVKE